MRLCPLYWKGGGTTAPPFLRQWLKGSGREPPICVVWLSYRSAVKNISSLIYHFQLSRLSVTGDHIVIMSIHQPRYSIFKLLDTLTLLSAGNVVYHGQANNALEYFRGAGKMKEA